MLTDWSFFQWRDSGAPFRLIPGEPLVVLWPAAGLDCEGELLRDIPAERLAGGLSIIGVNLRIVAPARDGHLGQPSVDELLVGLPVARGRQ